MTHAIQHNTTQYSTAQYTKLFNYRIAGKFGGNNVWRKWMDKDFGKIFMANWSVVMITDGTAHDVIT